jgi:hypothetical protein
MPSYAAHRDLFWYDWGPVLSRGRLDGSARLLGLASDPGPTEQVACRTLVGDAGQRVQGFLAKLGLTSSYVLVNAHPYAMHPSDGAAGMALLAQDPFKTWRNALLDLITGPPLQAIVAFGAQAHEAVDLWSTRPAGVLPLKVLHPSSHDDPATAPDYAAAITQPRVIVTSVPDGTTTGPNYGATITESDYAPIPRADLGFGAPAFLGDDAWSRAAAGPHANSVRRSDEHTIVWQAPPNQP